MWNLKRKEKLIKNLNITNVIYKVDADVKIGNWYTTRDQNNLEEISHQEDINLILDLQKNNSGVWVYNTKLEALYDIRESYVYWKSNSIYDNEIKLLNNEINDCDRIIQEENRKVKDIGVISVSTRECIKGSIKFLDSLLEEQCRINNFSWHIMPGYINFDIEYAIIKRYMLDNGSTYRLLPDNVICKGHRFTDLYIQNGVNENFVKDIASSWLVLHRDATEPTLNYDYFD